MALLQIKRYPDEVLSRKAAPVEAVDEAIRRLIDEMLETMYAAPGIGLAAPQVGVSRRLIVVDVGGLQEGESTLIALANPELVRAEGSIELEEGCLSLPGFISAVKRAAEVTVRGLDRDGRAVTVEAGGLVAVALQHEMDHLEGRLILDRVSCLKRDSYRKQLKKSLTQTG